MVKFWYIIDWGLTRVRLGKFLAAALSLVLAASLAGCAAAAPGGSSPGALDGFAVEVLNDAAGFEAKSDASSVGVSEDADRDVSPGQRWVTTLRYEAETRDYDATASWLHERVELVGGYVESENEYNRSSETGRSCDLVIRIPSARLDGFLDGFEDGVHLTRRSRSDEDVTLEYVDAEAWRDVLRAEQARLVELMGEAESLSDVLSIEDRLSEIKFDLERAESRLRVYDNQVDYATMYLNIREVRRFSHVPVDVGEELSEGVVENAAWVLDSAVGVLVWLVTHSPAILAGGGLVALALALRSRIRRARGGEGWHPVAAWRARRRRRREDASRPRVGR